MAKITKHDILSDRYAKVKDVYVEEWDGEVTLWSLTDGQHAHVESLRVRGLKLDLSDSISQQAGMSAEERAQVIQAATSGMAMDVEMLTYSDFLADAQAVAYALSGGTERWTITDVQGMRPASVVSKLAKEVYELTGVTKESLQAVEQFRAHGRGNGDSVPDDDWGAASANAGDAYTDAKAILAFGRSGIQSESEPSIDSGEYEPS